MYSEFRKRTCYLYHQFCLKITSCGSYFLGNENSFAIRFQNISMITQGVQAPNRPMWHLVSNFATENSCISVSEWFLAWATPRLVSFKFKFYNEHARSFHMEYGSSRTRDFTTENSISRFVFVRALGPQNSTYLTIIWPNLSPITCSSWSVLKNQLELSDYYCKFAFSRCSVAQLDVFRISNETQTTHNHLTDIDIVSWSFSVQSKRNIKQNFISSLTFVVAPFPSTCRA